MKRFQLHSQGKRGSILSLFGLVWIFIGWGFAWIPMNRFSRDEPGGILHFFDDSPLPGYFWMLCGLVALINGLFRRRKFDNEDAVGYAALVMPPMLWVAAYGWSFGLWVATYDTPEPFGRQTGFLGVLVFGVLAAIIRIVANWHDDTDYPPDTSIGAGSGELALLDRMEETPDENAARGNRARVESELWIAKARIHTEEAIAASAEENDRMIQSVKDELDRDKEADS